MAKIEITFETNELAISNPSQTELALNKFESLIGKTLPTDYRQHMLLYNGGDVVQNNIEHKDYVEDGGGISYFYPIGIGDYTIEEVFNDLINTAFLPSGYIPIGTTTAATGTPGAACGATTGGVPGAAQASTSPASGGTATGAMAAPGGRAPASASATAGRGARASRTSTSSAPSSAPPTPSWCTRRKRRRRAPRSSSSRCRRAAT